MVVSGDGRATEPEWHHSVVCVSTRERPKGALVTCARHILICIPYRPIHLVSCGLDTFATTNNIFKKLSFLLVVYINDIIYFVCNFWQFLFTQCSLVMPGLSSPRAAIWTCPGESQLTWKRVCSEILNSVVSIQNSNQRTGLIPSK